MKLLLIPILLMLTGCGTLNTYVAAQSAAAIKDTQAANDNLVKGIEASICEVPVGAVFRNIGFIPVVQAACVPAGDGSNPNQLLTNAAKGAGTPLYEQSLPAAATSSPPASQALTPTGGPAPATLTPGTPLFPAKKAAKTKPLAAPLTPAPTPAPPTTTIPAFGTLAPNPNFPTPPSLQPSSLPGGLPGQ